MVTRILFSFKNPNIKQYDPNTKQFIINKNPELFIKEHIIRGDRGDGVPNLLSPDETFVSKTRQKTIRQNRLEELINMSIDELSNENMLRGYIPASIVNKILVEFFETKNPTTSQLENFKNEMLFTQDIF